MEILSRHALLAHAPKTSHTYKNSVHGSTKHTHKFSFSRIFDERTTQKDFFDECMLNTVKDFIDGQNCLIFTYGEARSCKLFLSYFSADEVIGVDSEHRLHGNLRNWNSSHFYNFSELTPVLTLISSLHLRSVFAE